MLPLWLFPVLHRTKICMPLCWLLHLLYENTFANCVLVRVNQIHRKEEIIFVSLFALTPSKDESKLNFSVKGCSLESKHDNAFILITMFSLVCFKRAIFLIDWIKLIPSESWVNSGVHSLTGSFHFISHLHAAMSLYNNWFFCCDDDSIWVCFYLCCCCVNTRLNDWQNNKNNQWRQTAPKFLFHSC